MPRLFFTALVPILALSLIASHADAQVKDDHTIYLGSALMEPNKSILENLSHSRDQETFVQAIKLAGLEDTLRTPGPFTVFAPTTEAFNKLPPAVGDNLLKPDSSLKLLHIVNFHIIPGRLTVIDIAAKAREQHGAATYKTLGGEMLTFTIDAQDILWLTDNYGSLARITIPDIEQSNGIVHVIDTVLLPLSVGF